MTVIFCSSKEIKLLMNELDEEKRIRLTLQVRHEEKKGIQTVKQLECYVVLHNMTTDWAE